MISNRTTNIIAAVLLTLMFFMAVFSMKDDSATMDELAHLPAGYSYLTQKDMRLNPEHPPLIKDLAGFPLLFVKNINFPSEIDAWKEKLNGQWEFGNYFLYKVGNDADKLLFLARLPMIFLLILLGFFIFYWVKKLWGNKVALLSLFLFTFSPTFLSHGRLVTTDVGAAFGVILATYFFLNFLKEPTLKNLIFSGLTLGISQLIKFSLILLYPFFGFLLICWIIFSPTVRTQEKLKTFGIYLGKFFAIFLICFLLIWSVYFFHTLNLPNELQKEYIKIFTRSHPLRSTTSIGLFFSQNPILRPLGYYLLGVFMATERAAGGHTTYFLGEVSATGWLNYFPIVYLIKEPLTFHILTLIAILYAAYLIRKPFWQKPISRIKDWIKTHFNEFSMISWIFIYWITSLISNLNIGVRHLLPVFPFTYILVSLGIINFLKKPLLKPKILLFSFLIFWQIFSLIKIYPHFLSYFNEIAGGPDKGYIYTVNSNYDWGQDLKRLKKWVDENEIDKIYVDYFGGSDSQYYLKEKFIPWEGTKSSKEFEKGNYLAVSATFLQAGKGIPVLGFNQPHGYYLWLNNYQPIAKAGKSIFIYYID